LPEPSETVVPDPPPERVSDTPGTTAVDVFEQYEIDPDILTGGVPPGVGVGVGVWDGTV